MDNKKIISELNRVRYLFSYERGVVISEQTKIPQQSPNDSTKKVISKTQSTDVKQEGGETIISKTSSEQIKLSERFVATYSEEDSDPKQFLMNAYNKVIQHLNTQNPEKLPIIITRAKIIGTASNEWGQSTKYDSDNNYNYLGGETPTGNTEKTKDGRTITFNKNYIKNKNLAYSRAIKFWESILPLLTSPPKTPPEKPSIKITENVKPEITQMVVDTGGVTDNVRVTNPNIKKSYPNPGQTVLMELDFVYEQKKVSIERIPGISIPEKGISTSTYWCDGTDGTGQSRPYPNLKKFCVGKRNEPAKNKGGEFNTSNGTKDVPRVKNITVGSYNPKSLGTISISDIVWQINSNPEILEYPKMVSTEHDYIVSYIMNYGTWEFTWNEYKIVKITRRGITYDIIPKKEQINGFSSKPVDNILTDQNKELYLKELLIAMNLKKRGEDAYRKSFEFYVKPYL